MAITTPARPFGLSPRLEARAASTYIGEIYRLAKKAVRNWERFQVELKAAKKDLERIEMMSGEITDIAESTAAISRYFWPGRPGESGTTRVERGAWLRGQLEIKDASELKPRTARNAIDHLDQELDDLLLSGSTQEYIWYVDCVAEGLDLITPEPEALAPKYVRAYITSTGELRVMDGKFDIPATMNALADLLTKCEEWLAAWEDRWDPYGRRIVRGAFGQPATP